AVVCVGVLHAGLAIAVGEFFEVGQLVVGPGVRHHWGQIIHDGGVRAPLCLGPFAGVVDDVGIDVWKVIDQLVGRAFAVQPDGLAGKPLQTPVSSKVDDAISVKGVSEPAIERHVVVWWLEVRIVIYLRWVHTEPAWRLHSDEHIPTFDAWDRKRTVGSLAPLFYHVLPKPFVHPVEPLTVLLGWDDIDASVADVLGCNPAVVEGELCRQLVNEFLSAFREFPIEIVAPTVEFFEEIDRTLWAVETERCSDAVVARRVVVEDDGDLFLLIWCVSEGRPVNRKSRGVLDSIVDRKVLFRRAPDVSRVVGAFLPADR